MTKTIRNALGSEVTCAVCQDIFEKPQALIPCLHTFCLECITDVMNNSSYHNDIVCPVCRKLSNSFVPNFAMQNIVDIFKDTNLNESESGRTSSLSTNSPSTSSGYFQDPFNDSSTDFYYDTNAALHGIESISITERVLNPSSPISSSSYQSVADNEFQRIEPCKSCTRPLIGYQCPIPITDENQSGQGHILCGFCYEYMPARGKGGIEPALDQCCSFCGIVSCDAYWTCSSTSKDKKLYKLNEIRNIEYRLRDINSIVTPEDGHLNSLEIDSLIVHLTRNGTTTAEAWQECLTNIDENIYITPIFRKMTPLALEFYNTRRLPKYYSSTNNGFNEEDEEDDYFNKIEECGVRPSSHLIACNTCLATVVNGQFYGYWKSKIENRLVRYDKEKCIYGNNCETQWTNEAHAIRLSHIETELF